MKLKTKLWIGIVLLILAGAWWYWSTRLDASEGVVTETVSRTDVFETVSVSGELVPVSYADLSFQTIGTVDQVYVALDEVVQTGDPLATLDHSVLDSQLSAARIAQSIAEENEKSARRSWDDFKPEQREMKRLESEAAREDARTIAAQIEKSVIRAPFTGKISRIDLRSGETVAIGSPVFRMTRDMTLIVEARVPESDIVKLALGMEAEVTFDALDADEIFRAKVSAIDLSSTTVQDVVSYTVTFEVAGLDARLKDGMSADIDIVTAKRERALAVPFRALITRGEKTFATKSHPDGTMEEVAVTTGLEGDDGTVEILSGLQEGDTVVVSAVSE